MPTERDRATTLSRALTGAGLIAFATLTGCATASAGHGAVATAHTGSDCRRTVRGVVSARGALVPGWLPRGFRQQAGYQPPSALPQASFTEISAHPDPPRVMLGTARLPGPLTPAEGGRSDGKPVNVQGQ